LADIDISSTERACFKNILNCHHARDPTRINWAARKMGEYDVSPLLGPVGVV